LKVSANVKISIQYFENFGGANAPNAPLVGRLVFIVRFSSEFSVRTQCKGVLTVASFRNSLAQFF